VDLLAFFLLTFTFTWLAWVVPAVLAPGAGGFLAPGGPLFLLGVFAPALAALGLTGRREGRDGLRRLLARIGRWKVGARWYVFAVGYMAAMKLAAALVHRGATGAWPVFGDTPWLLLFGAIVISMWVQAGEEIGWRGYALPRLTRHLSLGGAGILLGVIWALWHLPLFLLPGTGSDGQSFPLYLLHVTALSVAMAWLYWKTEGSLLLVMVMHASVNNTTGIVPAAVPGATDAFTFSGSLVGWATVALAWLVAAALLFRMRGATLERRTNPDASPAVEAPIAVSSS
jgi:membrane protease YdiL (CAAX protease family)